MPSFVAGDLFYHQLPERFLSLTELLNNEKLFSQVPADWHVIITDIWYGIHISRDSVMSCYVRDLEDGHIHFVECIYRNRPPRM